MFLNLTKLADAGYDPCELPRDLREEYYDIRRKCKPDKAWELLAYRIARQDRIDLPFPVNPNISIQAKMILTAAHICYCTPEDILGRSRFKQVGTARSAVVVALRHRNPEIWSYPAIGKVTNRHHTSTGYLVLRGEERYKRDEWFKKLVDRLGGL